MPLFPCFALLLRSFLLFTWSFILLMTQGENDESITHRMLDKSRYNFKDLSTYTVQIFTSDIIFTDYHSTAVCNKANEL